MLHGKELIYRPKGMHRIELCFYSASDVRKNAKELRILRGEGKGCDLVGEHFHFMCEILGS